MSVTNKIARYNSSVKDLGNFIPACVQSTI
jgi:hypothetical protein